MILIRVRACIRCKEFVAVHPENPSNQKTLKDFEKEHLEHAIVTVDLDEVKGRYRNLEEFIH